MTQDADQPSPALPNPVQQLELAERGLALPAPTEQLELAGISFSPTGAAVTGPVTTEGIVSALTGLSRWESTARWVAGDLVLALEDLEDQAAAVSRIASLGYSQAWLALAIEVARSVPPSNRRVGLSWGHHEVAAALDVDEQELWLGAALSSGWTIKDFARRVDEYLREDQPALDGVEGGEPARPWRLPPVVGRRIGEILAVEPDAWVLVHPKTGEARLFRDGKA